jgi:hypothetical protein
VVLFAVVKVTVFLYLGDWHRGQMSRMTIAMADSLFRVNGLESNHSTEWIGEHYMDITTIR